MIELAVLLAARLLAAARSPVPDCDEVFNFWEPTHFLTHGAGLQTWEWSPVYAIRSWSYIALHAVVIYAAKMLGFEGPQLFFALRVVLGSFEAVCEYQLIRVLRKHYDTDVAYIFTALSAVMPGLFHASVAYLPSAFAMNCITLAFAWFLDSPTNNIVCSLVAIAVGGVVGWPFVLVLALPFGIYYSITVFSVKRWISSVVKTLGLVSLLLMVVVALDSRAFGKLAVVPFNIVGYNVLFADEASGPNIFGTEPLSYYLLNLFLNFNVAFPLALLAGAVVNLRTLTGLSLMYLWFAILFPTPHKEERFLYVVYPIIVSAAAFTISRAWHLVTSFARLPKAFLYLFVSAIAFLGVARSAALASYYQAPFEVYKNIPSGSTVCVGREWYRFPSSYFMDSQLKFVRSGFDGLLPGEFTSFTDIPEGMNNRNEFDEGKLVPLETCDYLVDIKLDYDAESGEIDPLKHGWEKDFCVPFLDTQKSTGLARVLYFGVDSTPLGKVSWTEYCRYRRSK